ncbi:MAG TPA: PAS domain S-box protein, partial [Nitrospiria bacterium]|nr:PAS domain S-box protein [Nitrospiria bacterium]
VAINSVLPKAFMAFTLPIVVPLMGRFLIEGETVYSLMGIMTMIFTGAMFAAAFQFRALTERSLRLGFENHEMFLRLSEEKKRTAQLSEELTDQTWKERQIQEAVRFIAEKTVDKTGQGFFDSLTQHLATAFRVRYAFLIKLDPKEKDRGRIFSFWSGSGFEKSFEFQTQAPPFNEVLTGDVVHFPTGAGRLFGPEARFASMDIEGLLVFPLKDSEGRLVGQICLMHHRIIPKSETHLSVLKLFSIRVIGEIQRQRFENDLRVFRSLIDRANDAVFIIDPEEARFVDVNQKAIDRLGYTSGELLGMSVFDISLGMRGKKDWKENIRKLKEVSSMTLEGTHRRKNGSTFPVEIGASFISFGEKEFVVAVARDITSRRKTEAALARVSRQSELILAHSEEGICGLDEEGNLSFLNPAGARMLGWEPGELIGKPKHEILHHTRADKTPYPLEECRISAALRDGTVHHSRGEVFWRKDKTSFPVEYTSSPIREEGKVTGAVVVFRDITKIKKEEEARVQLLVKRNERLSALGELVS